MANNADKTNKGALSEKELSQQVRDYEDRLQFFQNAIGTLLVFIKDFSLDLNEINAEAFKKEMDELNEKISSVEKTKKLHSVFEKYRKIIFLFVEQLKKHLNDREDELKGIIDLLTKAMSTVDADNQLFNQKIYEQSERIEKITLLDDIKKIKGALKYEIENVREAIKEKKLFDKEHLEKLSKKVETLNLELEKARAESLIDGLTGAYNRLAFDRYMISLVERNADRRHPFSLLFLDIDNFKDINDTYGHPIGDRVILALIQKCREITRKDDYIARFGGDEFAIVMPKASIRNASKKAKQLAKVVAGTRYAVNTDEDSHDLSFTVSVGVSAYRKGDTALNLTERADKALYMAKHSGKARVVIESELE